MTDTDMTDPDKDRSDVLGLVHAILASYRDLDSSADVDTHRERLECLADLLCLLENTPHDVCLAVKNIAMDAFDVLSANERQQERKREDALTERRAANASYFASVL